MNNQEGNFDGDKKISRYNSGVAIQIRLDILWRDANYHARVGQFSKWNCDLDRVWCELSRDISEEEYEDKVLVNGQIKKGYKSQFEEFDGKIFKLGDFKDNIADSFEKPTSDDIKNRSKQYKLLMEKELFLKRLENHLGKGSSFDDEDESDF